MERFEFVKKTLRLGILAGIAGGTAHLAMNDRIDFTCSSEAICKTCGVYKDCGLEKAIKARENERK